METYPELLYGIDDCFSVYPGGFFNQFRCGEAEKGLRILLANRILVEGSTMAGVTTVQDGYYNIFLGIGTFNNLNVHHELWHAMEFRITWDNQEAFANWADLNPVGFNYDENYFLEDIWTYAAPKDDYFVRGYSNDVMLFFSCIHPQHLWPISSVIFRKVSFRILHCFSEFRTLNLTPRKKRAL